MLVAQNLFSQTFDATGEVNVKALASTGDRLPFWLHSNQRGRVYEESNISTLLKGMMIYEDAFEDLHFEAGAGILFLDGTTTQKVVADEVYGRFQNSWTQLTLGRKQPVAVYNGLSATNEDILKSLNARPLPGVEISTNGLIFPFKYEQGLGFDAGWGEYLMEEERFMQEARLHHKRFSLAYRTAGNFQVEIGYRHYAQWGGNAREGTTRELSQSYSDAISLKHNSQHHLTSYKVRLSQEFRSFALELLYDHIATDESGRHFANTPDGRYGIFFHTREKDRIINSAIYELYYTQNQSYESSGFIDNYFNHHVYRSGWTYMNKVIGAPFFTYDPEADRIVNNKFTAHHVGIGGQFSTYFKTYPYRLLLSFSRNDGVYERRYRPEQNIFSGYFDMRILNDFIDINLELGTEINNTASPNFGAGVHLKYQL